MPKSGLTAIKEVIANNLCNFSWIETKTPPPRTRNYSTYFSTQYGICQIELEWCSNGWGSGHVIIHIKDRHEEIIGSYNLHTITDDTYKLTKKFLQEFANLMVETAYLGFDIDVLNKYLEKYYQEKLTEALRKK